MDQSAPAPQMDDAPILASVANDQYRHSAKFVPVSGKSYPSAVAAPSRINVWVTAADYPSYARITPDKSGSGATLAPGAMVIREVLDAKGAVAKLTLMVKGPAGYNPSLGDFWFGVTQPDGTPEIDNGIAKLGKLGDCFGCHTPRASDGFLFGVPMADRLMNAVDGGTPPPTDEDDQ
jgi:hypothetical protein